RLGLPVLLLLLALERLEGAGDAEVLERKEEFLRRLGPRGDEGLVALHEGGFTAVLEQRRELRGRVDGLRGGGGLAFRRIEQPPGLGLRMDRRGRQLPVLVGDRRGRLDERL